LEYFGRSSKSKDNFKAKCKACRKIEYENNKEYKKQKSKERYESKKDEILVKNKEYKEKNKEWYKKYHKEYYQKNKDEIKKRVTQYHYKKIKEDVGYRLLQRCRKRLYEAVKGNIKSARTKELIGCSVENLMHHLESQFTEGMNWDNYGKWHVDHIKPCSEFNFSKEEQQRECFHYTNLQPLWAKDNHLKSNKYQKVV